MEKKYLTQEECFRLKISQGVVDRIEKGIDNGEKEFTDLFEKKESC